MNNVDIETVERTAEAAADIVEVMQSLAATGSNIVLEVLQGAPFVEFEHYPVGDICDPESGSQYYFHAHPPVRPSYSDFGHFHLFLRPREDKEEHSRQSRSDRGICHLGGISVDRRGFPVGLFTANRWVTDEAFYPADATICMLRKFKVEGPTPSHLVNRWVSAMPILFRTELHTLIRERDARIKAWRQADPDSDVFEDRRLEIISWKKIDIENKLAEIRAALNFD